MMIQVNMAFPRGGAGNEGEEGGKNVDWAKRVLMISASIRVCLGGFLGSLFERAFMSVSISIAGVIGRNGQSSECQSLMSSARDVKRVEEVYCVTKSMIWSKGLPHPL